MITFFSISLIGQWIVTREITAVDGITSFHGTSDFIPLPDGALHYAERGEMTLPHGHSLPAFRSSVFKPHATGFTVFFDETPRRLFHEISLHAEGDDLTGSATHFCAPDIYVSTYRFLADGSFHIAHEVSGPKKSYISKSQFHRPHYKTGNHPEPASLQVYRP